MFTLELHPGPDHLVLRLSGELDLHSRSCFRDHLQGLAEQSQPVVIDLSELKFIDSSGVGVLLSLVRVPEAQRPQIVLARTDGPVARLLRCTGLDHLLAVQPSIEAALARRMPAWSAA